MRLAWFPAIMLPVRFLGLVLSLGALTLSCRDGSGLLPTPPSARVHPASLLLWRTPNVPSVARPVVDSARIYLMFSLDPHVVTALDRKTGALLWTHQLTFADPPGLLGGFGLVLAGGRLVVGDAEIWGLDPATGAVAWHYARPSAGLEVPSGLTLTTDGITVFSASRGFVYAVDGRTGAERFVTPVWNADRAGLYTPQYVDGSVYVGVAAIHDRGTPQARADGGVVSVSASSGQLQWARVLPRTSDIEMSVFEIAVSESHVIAPSADGNVYLVDRATGALAHVLPRSMFIAPTPPPPQLENYAVTTAPGTVVISDYRGYMTALDSRTLARRWSRESGQGTVNDMHAVDGHLYVAHVNAVVRVLRLDDGALMWYLGARDLRPDGEEGSLAAPAASGDTVFIGGVVEAYALRRR